MTGDASAALLPDQTTFSLYLPSFSHFSCSSSKEMQQAVHELRKDSCNIFPPLVLLLLLLLLLAEDLPGKLLMMHACCSSPTQKDRKAEQAISAKVHTGTHR